MRDKAGRFWSIEVACQIHGTASPGTGLTELAHLPVFPLLVATGYRDVPGMANFIFGPDSVAQHATRTDADVTVLLLSQNCISILQ